ncbi:PREDICTED: uncharacterized protein LOC109482937 [Branchiostoma belcheri]|uniref:Uncharacterized protein LOC109482937 n=1 Tax=Branchiostoma belcheri TaxID=7741 RepID=A0A6P4ZJJ2_BRABE|nr:PREDICTED: uncharacterized protein LOC109482937 [Branchiostoma belcheri]
MASESSIPRPIARRNRKSPVARGLLYTELGYYNTLTERSLAAVHEVCRTDGVTIEDIMEGNYRRSRGVTRAAVEETRAILNTNNGDPNLPRWKLDKEKTNSPKNGEMVLESGEQAERDVALESGEQAERDVALESGEQAELERDVALESGEQAELERDVALESGEQAERDVALESGEQAERDVALESADRGAKTNKPVYRRIGRWFAAIGRRLRNICKCCYRPETAD